jgi:ABC-type transport system involved in multi-copper enzyme maturation permease subunit
MTLQLENPKSEIQNRQVRPRWPPPRRTRDAAWIVARREMIDVVSDWRIVAPALLLIVVFPILMVILSAQGTPFLVRRLPGFSVAALVPYGLMAVGFFPVSFALVLALETFAGEKERNSLEALFSSPLSDRALYFGKLIAALVPPVIGSYISMVIYLLGVILVLGYRPDLPLLGSVAALNLAQALVMVASALIISSHTTSVRAANLLASFIILPMSLVLQISNIVVIWGAAPYLWLVALALALFAVLLLRMGLRLFNREAILAREMDDLRLGQAWAAYRRFLALPPRWAPLANTPDPPPIPARLLRFNLRRLYLHDLPVLLRLRWPELLLVTAALITAFAAGWALAGQLDLATAAAQGQLGTQNPLGGGGGAPGAGGALARLPLMALALVVLAGFLIVLAVISFGIGPVLFMMLVAGLFGVTMGTVARLGIPPGVVLAALALPQIALPALALLLLTVFSARFGLAITAPPPGFGLGESLLLAAAEYTKMLALVVPLLLAGFALQAGLFLLFR